MKKIKNLAALTELSSSSVNEVYQIPVDQIESKRQVRGRFENIEELAESFKSEGQQTPITITGPNSVGLYTILRGERRWRAAKLAGLATIDALISNKDQNQSDIVAGQLIENIQRENLTALEIATSIQELSEAGWSNRKIGQRLGKSEPYVSMHLSLNKLPDEIKELNNKGYVTDGSSLVTLRKMYEISAEKTLHIVQEIEANKGISRSQIRKYFADMQAPKDKEPIDSSLDIENEGQDAKQAQIDPPGTVSIDPVTEQKTSSNLAHVDDNHHEPKIEKEIDGVSNQKGVEPQVTATTDAPFTHNEPTQPDPFESLGARNIDPSRFVIDVLISADDNDYIGQLLIGYVSTSKDRAWVIVEGTPMEVDISAISIMEVREAKNENELI